MTADFRALGLAVGHASDAEGGTGVTVVRGEAGPFRAAAALLGRATGTRELGVLTPGHLVDRVDAIMLTGGSAYGLDAAAGVMRWLEERGRGFAVGPGVVPIVPAAVIFDLVAVGRFDSRPTAEMAYKACDAAVSTGVAEGSVGAGTGATVGKIRGPKGAMKAGFGCWGVSIGSLHVAAMAVVNALGDVRDAEGRIIAGARSPSGGFLDAARLIADAAADYRFGFAGRNTTLAVVATNAHLSRLELSQLATASSAALFRRITPTGTSYDGDIIFAVAPLEGLPADSLRVETLAVSVLEMAIERAVRLARGWGTIPGLADER